MECYVNPDSDHGKCTLMPNAVEFTPDRDLEQAFFRMVIDFPDWEDDCYILMPACAYNGNRIRRVVRKYPPMYHPEETGETLMTEVPALNPDGSGEIQVTAGDMATPCVGIFNRHSREGFLLFTEQQVGGKNLGFTVKKGQVTVSFPANRTDLYRFCRPHETGGDTGIQVQAGETVRSAYQIHQFPCEDIPGFYREFFGRRKMLLRDDRAPSLYTENLWNLLEDFYNTTVWSGEYYGDAMKNWRVGWGGSVKTSFAMLKSGTEQSKERARLTLDYLCSHQAPSGFYYGKISKGIIEDDSFGVPGMEKLHLIRRSADAMYFLFKHFFVEQPKPAWVESARRCADAFVTLFERYGTFGQFVDVETGDMRVSDTFSGVMAVGGLALAGKFFGESRYLEAAKAAMNHYETLFAETGITNGGPGEILGAPDSETAFAMLESAVVLYEVEEDARWLSLAETAACYCSSWVVTYAFRFPEGSEFHRLNINTVGSIFANVQNKHSAPGICTMSGDCLYKLYKFTGKEAYLELIKDIVYFIPQCVSTEEQPIYSWDKVPRKLPAGYINERVNMSDWEGPNCVGGVFYGTCWPGESLLLTFAELMVYDEMK